jgi:hypothetical protein
MLSPFEHSTVPTAEAYVVLLLNYDNSVPDRGGFCFNLPTLRGKFNFRDQEKIIVDIFSKVNMEPPPPTTGY